MRRRALQGGLLAVPFSAAVVLGATSAAQADDPTPAPAPTITAPTITAPTITAPTITAPVSPPSQQQIDDARRALERLSQQGTRSPRTLSEVAGPTAEPARASVVARIGDQDWWTIGAGVLVLLVASEATRLGVRRAKHRGTA